MARRGKPTVIYSYNGTNFVGTDRELRECIDGWNQRKIGSEVRQERIQWVFNPPAAPHMGGVWGRLVRSCKKALNVVVQNQVLTDELFLTASAVVEWVVNSRPLTEVRMWMILKLWHRLFSSLEEDLSTSNPVSLTTRSCQVTNVGDKHKWWQIIFGIVG